MLTHLIEKLTNEGFDITISNVTTEESITKEYAVSLSKEGVGLISSARGGACVEDVLEDAAATRHFEL